MTTQTMTCCFCHRDIHLTQRIELRPHRNILGVVDFEFQIPRWVCDEPDHHVVTTYPGGRPEALVDKCPEAVPPFRFQAQSAAT